MEDTQPPVTVENKGMDATHNNNAVHDGTAEAIEDGVKGMDSIATSSCSNVTKVVLDETCDSHEPTNAIQPEIETTNEHNLDIDAMSASLKEAVQEIVNGITENSTTDLEVSTDEVLKEINHDSIEPLNSSADGNQECMSEKDVAVEDEKEQYLNKVSVEEEMPPVEDIQDEAPQTANKKLRPTPEAVALDRGIQNITRKAHKNNKGGDKKLVELLVRLFDNCGSPEAKMEGLAKKYVQLAAEHKENEQKMSEIETKYGKVRKERDHLQAEHNKLLIAKGKLESLCRELQKHNKAIKEETQRRADDEDRKRKELSQKFQATISDITQQMAENHKRNQQLKQDNNDLAQKLKGLVEQYEVREQHIEKVLKAKQLELQLCEAKLQQQNLVMQEEVESNLREKHSVLEESLIYKKKCEELLRQEAELRAQLALYTEKFEEFQATLTKSNEVFGTFKKDMDTMTKTIRKLEKESQTWKSRWENTNRSLLEMVDERSKNHTTIATLNTKVEKLEKLCRALQIERKNQKSVPNKTGQGTSDPKAIENSNAPPENNVEGTKSPNNQPLPVDPESHGSKHSENIPSAHSEKIPPAHCEGVKPPETDECSSVGTFSEEKKRDKENSEIETPPAESQKLEEAPPINTDPEKSPSDVSDTAEKRIECDS